MTKAGINEGLKKHLAANPQIPFVYFSKTGEWQFHDRKGYREEVASEDVLAEDFYPDGLEVEAGEAPVETGKAKLAPVEDIIAAIGEATTEEEVTEALGGDVRKTAVKAAANKIAEIKQVDADLLG